MTTAPLSSLFYANRGSVSDKWEQYLAVYEGELRPWHRKSVSLLEIGVQNGGSMQVWAGYFDPASKLVGLDIDERIADLPHAENVEFFVADGTKADELFGAIGERTFDIIIDDGSHFSNDITNSIRLLFSRLNPGGRYFIEDLHCAYWDRFGGGLARPESAVEFLKRLVDVLHSDHLEDPDELQIDITDELLLEMRKSLAKVTFYDSIAVVERLPFAKLEPYRRVLAGEEGALFDPLELLTIEDPGRLLFVEPLARKLEDGVLRQIEQMHEVKVHNARLQGDLDSLAKQLAAERANAAAVDADRQRLDELVQHLEIESEVAEATRRDASLEAMRLLSASLQSAAQSKSNAEAATGDLIREADGLRLRLEESARHAKWLSEAVTSLTKQVAAIEGSFTHRMMRPVRFVARLARRGGGDASVNELVGQRLVAAPGAARRGQDVIRAALEARSKAYEGWREKYWLSDADRLLIDRHIATGTLPPVVVLLRVDTMVTEQINAALSALAAQRFPDWRAWISIAADCRSEAVSRAVAVGVDHDSRLHIVEADDLTALPINAAVVLLTSTSDVLSEHALYLFAEAAGRGIRFAYGDSESAAPTGNTRVPRFKPDLSPLHQRLHRYIGSTVAIDNRESSYSSTLSQFASARADIAATIEAVIASTPSAAAARLPHVVQREPSSPIVVDPIELAPASDVLVKVSIMIPTRDRLELLEPCIESLLAETDYPADLMEVIVVDNGSTDDRTLEFLSRGVRRGDFVVLRDEGDFNYSRLNNRAAAVATGEVLVLLNNDTTVFDPKWLRFMVAHAVQPGVGAVGGKLLYPDLSVQHGGVVLGIQGVAAHVNHMRPDDHEDYHEVADYTHEVAAVTGACLAIRAEVYRELEGLDESLAVSFNDVDLCCGSLARGYRNVYIGSPLVIHHESKSRGYDIMPEQLEAFRREAIRARSKHPELYRDDPYYSPNFSLVRSYDLAEPPRAVRPWVLARRRAEPSRCILMLSSTYQVGHGVAVVVDIQARHLAALGHRVILGGPRSTSEFSYGGCERVVLQNELEAATFAYDCGADVVMMHTPPFFATARWLGSEQTKIAYDYGEPGPELFPDAAARRGVLADKHFSIALADLRFAISESVRGESESSDMGVIPLGNAHLAAWSSDHQARRDSLRQRMGWTDKVVVFNVCRFHGGERNYKGVYAYSSLLQVTRLFSPDLAARLVFVLCGKADPDDVREMDAWGLTVFPNVSDEEMIELYAAADIYVNLSKWEGYNLGIGQALAMGLPTLGSDIPAHRAFGITTTDDVVEQIAFLERQVAAFASSRAPQRQAQIWPWDVPLEQLAAVIAAT